MVADLKQQGVPIDGVGFQFRYQVNSGLVENLARMQTIDSFLSDVDQTVKRYAKLGVLIDNNLSHAILCPVALFAKNTDLMATRVWQGLTYAHSAARSRSDLFATTSQQVNHDDDQCHHQQKVNQPTADVEDNKAQQPKYNEHCSNYP